MAPVRRVRRAGRHQHPAARHLHVQGVHGPEGTSAPASSTWSTTPSTRSAASTPRASSAGTSTPSRCCCSASAGVLFMYGLLRLQGHLPFNPDHMAAVSPGISFNTAVSFVTNTNWQVYAGESTMSQLSPDAGAGRAAVPVGGGGHGRGGGLDPGHHPQAPAAHAGQLLGGHDPRRRPASCCPSASCSPSCSCPRASIQNFSAVQAGDHGGGAGPPTRRRTPALQQTVPRARSAR